MMIVVAYLRQTLTESEYGLASFDEQEAIIERWAYRRNAQVLRTYRDCGEAVARGDGSSRDGLIELLDACRGGGFDAVVAISRNRLARDEVFDLDICAELRLLRKRVVFVDEDPIDLRPTRRKKPKPVPTPPRPPAPTPGEKMIATRLEIARGGCQPSGAAPFGYERDRKRGGVLVAHPEQARVVQLIFREYLRQKSLQKLARRLEELRVHPPRAEHWSRAGLAWILKNRTYIGRVRFGPVETRGRHKPIVAPIVFNKVQKLMKRNRRPSGRRARQG